MLSFYLTAIADVDEKITFEKIYYNYRKQMIYVALSILENNNDAEDAVHTVFCKIAEKHMKTVQTLNDEQDLRCYLLKAVKNTALNMKRDSKNTVSLEEIDDVADGDDNDFLDEICSKAMYSELLNAIKNLSKTYSDVLYLHFVLEMKVNDIAEFLNRNKDTVKKQLVRGKKLLIESISVKRGEENDKSRSVTSVS